MLRDTPERAQLRCPTCRSHEGSHPLHWANIVRADDDEVLDGALGCRHCGASYPVEAGVAVVLREAAAFLEGSRTDPALSTYLWADYLRDLDPLPIGLRADPHPVQLLVAELQPTWHVLDLGCGTGGATFAMAAAGSAFALGIDRSWERIEAAIRLRRTGRYLASIPAAVGHVGEVQIDRPDLCGASCDFLVGDAIDPPLSAASWDAVVLGMVYDTVRAPGLLLGQAGALLRDHGLLLAASPYQFTDQTEHRPADPAMDLRSRLATGAHGTRFSGISEGDALWILRDNARRYFAYLVDTVLARKEPTS